MDLNSNNQKLCPFTFQMIPASETVLHGVRSVQMQIIGGPCLKEKCLFYRQHINVCALSVVDIDKEPEKDKKHPMPA